MRVRGHANRNDEPGITMDEVGSMRGSESVAGYDAVASNAGMSETPSSVRQASSMIGMSSTSGGPTIRSRVTVVCAECKKQKLKCDRRIPCESCVKRNTVSRCIYTPAAIEKVDVTSINNRLRVVEGSLNALGLPTHGYQYQVAPQIHGPTDFAPAAAKSNVPLPTLQRDSGTSQGIAELSTKNGESSGWQVPMPRILAVANDSRCATTASPLDGISALWVRELVQDKGSEGCVTRAQRDVPYCAGGNMVSNKSMCMDLEPIDREASGGVPAFGFGGSRDMRARQVLELHAGLGIARTAGDLHHQQTEIGTKHASVDRMTKSDSNSYTTIAAQLLAQFPSKRARREMLIHLGMANLIEGISCVPFRALCAGVESTCSFTLKGFADGACNDPLSTIPAFSAIAEAAAALAVGALLWASEGSPGARTNKGAFREMLARSTEPLGSTVAPQISPSPLSSTSSALPSKQRSEHNEGDFDQPDMTTAYALYSQARLALAMHTARHGHAARDVAFIHAHVLCVYYLLLAQSMSVDFSDAILPPEVPPLVGALVWDARAMGLDVDPDQFDSPDTAQSSPSGVVTEGAPSAWTPVKREEDSDALANRRSTKGMSLFMKEVRRRLWWRVVLLDLIVSDALGYNATIIVGEYSTRLPANVDDTCFHLDSVTLPPPDENVPERNNTFRVAKLRLLELSKRPPVKAFRSGLVPTVQGTDHVTTVAAQQMANEIRQWLEDLPERYKFGAPDDDYPPFSSSTEEGELMHRTTSTMLIAQRCDLVFHANHMLLRLFTPRIFSPGAQHSHRTVGHSWLTDAQIPVDQQFASLRAIEPALSVVRAAEMQMTHASDVPRGIYLMYGFPRRLFDAAVLLAYTAIQQPLYTSPVVIDAVRSALSILSSVLKRDSGQAEARSSHSTEAEHIVGTLLQLAERARTHGAPIMAGVKRKLEEAEIETHQLEGPFRFPFLGSGVANNWMAPPQTSSTNNDTNMRMPGDPAAKPPGSMKSSSSNRTRDEDQSSRQSHLSGHRARNVPVVFIHQRLRDRKDGRSSMDVPKANSTIPEAGPPSALLQPSHIFSHQGLAPGHSVSSSPSTFTSDFMSASPASPVPQYNSTNGTRPGYPAHDNSFQENTVVAPSPHPTVVMTFQESSPSSTASQYPIPSFTASSHTAPPYLHHLPNRKRSLSRAVVEAAGDTVYSAGSSHAESSSFSTSQDEANNAQTWSFNEPSNMRINDTTALYPMVQQPYPPEAWNAGEPAESGRLASPWGMLPFTNWNNEAS